MFVMWLIAQLLGVVFLALKSAAVVAGAAGAGMLALKAYEKLK